jgi:hypothetical protein
MVGVIEQGHRATKKSQTALTILCTREAKEGSHTVMNQWRFTTDENQNASASNSLRYG